MDKRLKRFLSLALAVMMVISLMPSNAFATSTTVAKIDAEEYTDLQEALNAGGEIVLQADVALTAGLTVAAGKEVVLDLNGYSISQNKAQTEGHQMILNDGTLTIRDSSTAKTGKISYTDSGNGGEYISDTIYNRALWSLRAVPLRT